MRPSVGIASACTAAMLVAGGCGQAGPGVRRPEASGRLADNLWRSHDLGDRRPRDIRRFRAAGIADGGAAVPGGRPFDLRREATRGNGCWR